MSLRSSSLQSLVRPGTVTGGKPKPAAKHKATFQFSPNVNKASTAQTNKTATEAQATAGPISIQNLLAHKLAVSQTTQIDTLRANKPNFGARIIPTTIQSKLAQYESLRRSKRDSKKSREILELSWPPEEINQNTSLYTPISLPYVMRQDDPTTSRKSQRPSIKYVDEANRSSAAIFDEEE